MALRRQLPPRAAEPHAPHRTRRVPTAILPVDVLPVVGEEHELPTLVEQASQRVQPAVVEVLTLVDVDASVARGLEAARQGRALRDGLQNGEHPLVF